MFGYATNETPELMPATLQYSHNILKRLADVRHSGECSELEPDAKSQVTLRYENGKPVEVAADRRLHPAPKKHRPAARHLQARAGTDQAAHARRVRRKA